MLLRGGPCRAVYFVCPADNVEFRTWGFTRLDAGSPAYVLVRNPSCLHYSTRVYRISPSTKQAAVQPQIHTGSSMLKYGDASKCATIRHPPRSPASQYSQWMDPIYRVNGFSG